MFAAIGHASGMLARQDPVSQPSALAEILETQMEFSKQAGEESAGAGADDPQVAALTNQLSDQKRRLAVACAQMAEFAVAKEKEARELKDAVLALLPLAEGKEGVEDTLKRMHERLTASAAEAAGLAKVHESEVAKQAAVAAGLGDGAAAAAAAASDGAAQTDAPAALEDESMATDTPASTSAVSNPALNFAERVKYIPIRLDLKERQFLRLLEAALLVSEYTDKVDIAVFRNKAQRITNQLQQICSILSGLVVASDYKLGLELIADKDFKQNEQLFQFVFELGRRHKIMNPEKMRTEYGKLVYLLQDSLLYDVQQLLEFKIVKPLNTVGRFLEERGGSRLLDDPLMLQATAEIDTQDEEGRPKPRMQVAREIKAKERARDLLAQRYATSQLSQEQILHCLYSIGDNNNYLRFNRDPIDRMITYLRAWFRPEMAECPEFSLGISVGNQGARLSHNHERQYNYVLQSLTLWREVATDMFKLWCLAEEDLLKEGNNYRLVDTGQGLNRIQQAPLVGREIHRILQRCQQTLGTWVGSSVVHLGDHNVPNALMFIDKYIQVPRILSPIVMCIEQIEDLLQDPALKAYIDHAFGGPERLRKTILTDFFRHGFDGSGADNFFDAGSCIDGRLTSAWNWCSKIEKKAYFPIFKLTGFQGFDGDWQK